VAPGLLSPYKPRLDTSTVQVRTGTLIKLDDVVSAYAPPRKVKIICTLGPACWSEEGLAALIDAGMNIARCQLPHISYGIRV
jgi:pyruvate kinase